MMYCPKEDHDLVWEKKEVDQLELLLWIRDLSWGRTCFEQIVSLKPKIWTEAEHALDK